MPEHCDVHRDEMAVIHEVRSDVKWIKGLTATLTIIFLPSLIAFFVYVSKVESRLCVVESKMEKMEKRLWPEPSH